MLECRMKISTFQRFFFPGRKKKTRLPLSNSQFSLVVSVLLELLLQSRTWGLWYSEARKNTEVYSCVIGLGVCLVQWKIHFRYSEPENIVLFIYHSLWIQKLKKIHIFSANVMEQKTAGCVSLRKQNKAAECVCLMHSCGLMMQHKGKVVNGTVTGSVPWTWCGPAPVWACGPLGLQR